MDEGKIRWRQIREHFHACLELPREERIPFLDSSCREDPELREEVRSLLVCHEDPRTLLPDRIGDPSSPPPDGRIDRYELIDLVGQGGMGVVYRARRADGTYEEEVAVKLLHGDLVGESLVRRFRQERQILADLKHPAIARLIDGGTASDGRPFLVMEFVDGIPIDRYCDQHGLDVRRRLRLFIEVCRAVHFAHQNLVIHRDLKPANLLVDASGAPKLLDFGVAKLIDPAAPEVTRFGADGQGTPMTPDFASPEQVTGRVITTASDIYALGAVLYLLLTGSRPLGNDPMALGELVEKVRFEEPVPPSVRVARDEDRETPRLDLDRDLDRVVAMAMTKDPAGRYSSAESLADDLERFLSGRPVLAREQTFAYRVRKFLSRHRWPCLIAASVMVAVGALTVGLLLQRDRLLEEQSLSQEVTSFLEGVFTVSTPEASPGRPVAARALLDQAVFDVRGRFADQPRVRARLMSTMGRAYLRLGHLEEAESLLESSLDTRRERYPAAHPAIIDSTLDLGELRIEQGDWVTAESSFENARVLIRGHGNQEDAQRMRALLGLAEVRRRQGKFQPALALQRDALTLARDAYGETHRSYADALYGLGSIHRQLGELGPAREALETTRDILRALHGDLHPEVARIGMQLGLLLEEEGRYEDAERLLRETREAQSIIYPEPHPYQADVLNNLASVVLTLERVDEAETLCREGLELRQKVLEPGHPAIGDSRNLLGMILLRQERLEAAEDSFVEAREIWRRRLGPDHAQIASASNNLGQLYRQRGEFESAVVEFREALRVYRQTFGEDHLQVATVLNNLAYLEKKRGHRAAARQLYGEAHSILLKRFGVEHPRTAVLANNLAMLLHDMGDSKAAEPLFRSALDGLAATLPAEHPNLGLIRKNFADSLRAQGRLTEAETLLREALDIYARAEAPVAESVVESARELLAEVVAAQVRDSSDRNPGNR